MLHNKTIKIGMENLTELTSEEGWCLSSDVNTSWSMENYEWKLNRKNKKRCVGVEKKRRFAVEDRWRRIYCVGGIAINRKCSNNNGVATVHVSLLDIPNEKKNLVQKDYGMINVLHQSNRNTYHYCYIKKKKSVFFNISYRGDIFKSPTINGALATNQNQDI